jgi:hypothetical protein
MFQQGGHRALPPILRRQAQRDVRASSRKWVGGPLLGLGSDLSPEKC